MAATHSYAGINLVKGFDYEGDDLNVKGIDGTLFTIPFDKIKYSAQYGDDEVELQIPFEDHNPTHDVLCEIRFYVPPKQVELMDEEGVEEQTEQEENQEESITSQIFQTITKKANIDKNLGAKIVSLEGLPLSVPRGKYTADLYTKEMRLHGSTFNYKVDYKNIKKAFLLPMNDDVKLTINYLAACVFSSWF